MQTLGTSIGYILHIGVDCMKIELSESIDSKAALFEATSAIDVTASRGMCTKVKLGSPPGDAVLYLIILP